MSQTSCIVLARSKGKGKGKAGFV